MYVLVIVLVRTGQLLFKQGNQSVVQFPALIEIPVCNRVKGLKVVNPLIDIVI